MGRLKGKFAAHRGKFGDLSAAPRSAAGSKFGCSPFFFPRPTRDGLPSGQKAKDALGAAGLGAAACPPRRWLGRTGRNSHPVSQPSPGARLSVCPAWGVCRFLHGGVGLGRGYLQNPPAKGGAVPLPRTSPISRRFSVLIYKHPAALYNPPAPQPRALFPSSRGGRADSAAVGALTRCRDPVNKSTGGRHLRR